MYKYNRYIVVRILGPMLLICGSLTGIIWLTQSLRFIDMIISQGIGFSTFIYISALLIPSLLWIILPISLFVSVIYVYNKIIMDSELVAIENSGISRISAAAPALVVAVGMTIISYFISLYLLPVSYREFKDTQNFVRDNYASLLLQEGVFNTPVKGLTIYIRERSGEDTFKGLLVHDNRNAKKQITMMAEQGRLSQTPSGPKFVLLNGNRQEIDYANQQVYILNFESYIIDLSAFEKAVENRWREPEERFMPELFNPANTAPALIPKLIAHAHYRITWPLYDFVLGLLAVALVLPSEFNRRKRWEGIIAGSIFSLSVIAVAVYLNSLVARNNSFSFLMYLNVGVSAMIGFYVLLSKNRLRK